MTHTAYAGARLANGVEQFLKDGDRMPLKLLLSEYRAADALAANDLQDTTKIQTLARTLQQELNDAWARGEDLCRYLPRINAALDLLAKGESPAPLQLVAREDTLEQLEFLLRDGIDRTCRPGDFNYPMLASWLDDHYVVVLGSAPRGTPEDQT